jgi:hypothetical protein
MNAILNFIQDELEMRRSKEKRRLLGIIKFIGQLYRHQVLVEMVGLNGLALFGVLANINTNLHIITIRSSTGA